MSTNEVQLFKAGVPTYLKSEPLNDITKSLLGGGKTNKRISIRGNVFRLVVNGKEIATSEDRAMKVVMINVAPKVHRTFYAGSFTPGAKESPDCWTADGERPDATAKNPQSDACHSCEKNIAGSGQGNTKACKFGRMVAVVLENDMGGDAYQLSLPAQSIFGDAEGGKMPLNAYAQFLAGFNVNITAVVTEMRFDTDSATPKLFFKALRPLTEDEYAMISRRVEDPDVKEMVKVSFKASTEAEAPAIAANPAAKASSKPERTVNAEEVSEGGEETTPKKRESKKSAPQEADKSRDEKINDLLKDWDD